MINGVILIILGLIFLLDRLNVIPIGAFISTYWPLVFIAWSIGNIIRDRKLSYSNGVILLVGIFLQLDKLRVFSINIWSIFFPILLMVLGVIIVINSKKK